MHDAATYIWGVREVPFMLVCRRACNSLTSDMPAQRFEGGRVQNQCEAHRALGKVALNSSVWRSPVRGMSSPSTMRRICHARTANQHGR